MTAPHRDIFRSTLLLGSGALITSAIGIVRLKAVALMIGPAGLGAVALLLNIVAVWSVVVGVGVNSSGVRQLATTQAQGTDEDVAAAWTAILGETLVLAILGSVTLWLLRRPVAEFILLQPESTRDVGWLALAVGLTILAGTAIALLNGYRRNVDIAWAQILGALLGTAAGLVALAAWSEAGIIAYVLVAPLSACLVAVAFALRVPRPSGTPTWPAVKKQGAELIRLGFPYMVSGVAMNLALLATRSTINLHLGEVALGLFSAVWIISVTYVTIAVQAMSVDFLPHYSGVSHSRERAAEVLSAQIEMALLLAAPILIFAAATAPWLLQIAYSKAFTPAASLLRWQILGDVLKLVSWPLTVAMLASGRGKTFLTTEAGASLFFVAATSLAIGRFGLEAPGIAYLAMYVLHASILLILSGRFLHFRLSGRLAALLGLVFIAAAAVCLVATSFPVPGAAIGIVVAIVAGVLALVQLKRFGALPAGVARLVSPRG